MLPGVLAAKLPGPDLGPFSSLSQFVFFFYLNVSSLFVRHKCQNICINPIMLSLEHTTLPLLANNQHFIFFSPPPDVASKNL
jgi:hypothetical protein